MVVVQAEKMSRSPRGGPRENTLKAQIRGREYAGSQNIYLYELPNGQEIKMVVQENLAATADLNLNEMIPLYFLPENSTIIGYHREVAPPQRAAAE